MSQKPPDKRPIIIKKVSGGHGGHHGGAWKVAYADFVTAMMAFFMVMWIMGMEPTTKESVQGYFQNPVGFKKGASGGQNPLSVGNSIKPDNAVTIALMSRDRQQNQFNAVAERIQERLKHDSELSKLAGNFDIQVTPDGLRIEITDAGAGDTFFEIGSSAPRPTAVRAFRLIGEELSDLENKLVVEGHTDARQYGRAGYSNWELSVDRANAARRVVVDAGVDPRRIDEVRGHADRDLRFPETPTDPGNRRVSFLLPFATPGNGERLEGAEAAAFPATLPPPATAGATSSSGHD